MVLALNSTTQFYKQETSEKGKAFDMVFSVLAQAATSGREPAPNATTQYSEQSQAPYEIAQDQSQPSFKDGLVGMAPFTIFVIVIFYLIFRNVKKR